MRYYIYAVSTTNVLRVYAESKGYAIGTAIALHGQGYDVIVYDLADSKSIYRAHVADTQPEKLAP